MIRFFVLSFLFLVPFPLIAADAGRIDRVTVFPDRALVERVVEARVQSGSGELVIAGLPAGLETESLRLSASGPDGLRLGAVETRRIRGAERTLPAARELEERIESMERDRQAIQYRLETIQMQLDALHAITRPPGEQAPDLTAWLRGLDAVGERAGALYADRLETEGELSVVDRELERLRRQLADLGREQRDVIEATLHYQSPAAGPATFRIEYALRGAGWQPTYELRLDSATGKLELTQYARIRQSSGEDWTQAALEVSLSRPALGGRLPELHPWFIDVRPPEDKHREAIADMAPEMQRTLATGARVAEAVPEWAEFEGADFSARYRVPGRVTVTGDNSDHRFSLARHEMDAAISARVVPRFNPQAYLFAAAEWVGDGPLLPGQASLFQDGVLVGQSRIGPLAPGGDLELAFGADESIEVSYAIQRDTRGSEGLLRRQQRQEREFLIEISNRHRRALEITVLDRMPVSRDERIRVELTADTDRPTERDLDDRPGVLAWTHDYEPGQTRQIRFGYQATYPEGLDGIIGW